MIQHISTATVILIYWDYFIYFILFIYFYVPHLASVALFGTQFLSSILSFPLVTEDVVGCLKATCQSMVYLAVTVYPTWPPSLPEIIIP